MTTNSKEIITTQFLKKTLENGFNTSGIEVQDFHISEASASGENYTSDLFRIFVQYKLPQEGIQKVSLIFKRVHVEGECRQILRESSKIEGTFYTEILPEMERLIGNSTLGPKCFSTDTADNLLVLADLKALGYELEDRLIGLDQAHCEIVLKKLAQFHASSMHIIKENPKTIEIFKTSAFTNFNNSEHFVKYFTTAFRNTINIIKDWPTYEMIAKKLEKCVVNLLEKCYEIAESKKSQLRALIHSDLWVNNVMFKYGNNNRIPTDAVLLDFQMMQYGNVGVDLQYFLNTSPQLDVLKSKRYDLLKVYYHTLKTTLEQLNYSPIPTWDDVRKEIRAREFLGLFFMACELPLVSIDKSASENFSIENFNDNSKEVHDAMYCSKRVQDSFRYCLHRFDELGVLDE